MAQPQGVQPEASPTGFTQESARYSRRPAKVHTNPTSLANQSYLSNKKVRQYVTFLTTTMSQQYRLSTGKRPHSLKQKSAPSPQSEVREDPQGVGRILAPQELPELQSVMRGLPRGQIVTVLQPAANDQLQPHTAVGVSHPETGVFAVHFSAPAGAPMPRSAVPPPQGEEVQEGLEDEPLSKRRRIEHTGGGDPSTPQAMQTCYVPFQQQNRLCLYPLSIPKPPQPPSDPHVFQHLAGNPPPQSHRPPVGLILSELAKSLGAKVKKLKPKQASASVRNGTTGPSRGVSPREQQAPVPQPMQANPPASSSNDPPLESTEKVLEAPATEATQPDISVRAEDGGNAVQNSGVLPLSVQEEVPTGQEIGADILITALPVESTRHESAPEAYELRVALEEATGTMGHEELQAEALILSRELPTGTDEQTPSEQPLGSITNNALALISRASQNLQAFQQDTEPHNIGATKQGIRLKAVQDSLEHLETLCRSLGA